VKFISNYRLFESTEVSDINSEIIDALSYIADIGFKIKIYDFYHNIDGDHGNLYVDERNSHTGTSESKLIKISYKAGYPIRSYQIEDWHKILGYGSSGFYFHSDSKLSMDFLKELSLSMSHLGEYNPQISFKDDTILILLDISKVSENKIDNKISEYYEKLRTLLNQANDDSVYVSYYEATKTLYLGVRSNRSSTMKLFYIAANLCPKTIADPNQNWEKNIKIIKKYANIAKEMEKDGYEIKFSNEDSYKYILKLVKI
jgi:hypothetical protein